MAHYIICEKEDLEAVGDSIRAKTGSSEKISLSEMPIEINTNINNGNTSAETCTVTVYTWGIPATALCISSENGTLINSGFASNGENSFSFQADTKSILFIDEVNDGDFQGILPTVTGNGEFLQQSLPASHCLSFSQIGTNRVFRIFGNTTISFDP